MFSAERLQQDLSAVFSERGYIFQIVHQAPIAEIYLNYPTDLDVSTEQAKQDIEAVIAQYDWGEIEQVYLVGRCLGETDPAWDVALEIAHAASQSIEVEPEAPRSQNPEDSIDPITTEIDDVESNSRLVDKVDTLFPDLTEYCFTRNQQLLKSEIVPPPEEIAQLVAQFHEFPLARKHDILSQLKEFFTGKASVNTQDDEQEWSTALEDLPGNYRRKASIWLSRYCLNPEQTLATVEQVLNPPVALNEEPKPTPPTHSTDSITNAATSSASAPQAPVAASYSPSFHHSDSQETFGPASSRQKINWLIPLIGFLITLVLVGMDVRGRYSPQQYAQVCKDSLASEEICQISGQLIGMSEFKSLIAEGSNLDAQEDPILDNSDLSSQEKAEAFLEEPEYGLSQTALGLCMAQAHINSGYIIKDLMDGEFADDEAIASINRVVPGIFNYQVDIPHKETQAAVSTSCALAGAPHGMAYISGDRLPEGWPEAPYKPQKTAFGFLQAGIKLNVLSSLSTYTLFSGVGMLVTILCGMAIQVESLSALYQAALVLGLAQYIMTLLPSFGIFSLFFQPAILSMILGVASMPIQGFQINWSAGYRLVGSTLIVVSLICKVLSFSLLYTLFKLLA